jgi:hypothetical protein
MRIKRPAAEPTATHPHSRDQPAAAHGHGTGVRRLLEEDVTDSALNAPSYLRRGASTTTRWRS